MVYAKIMQKAKNMLLEDNEIIDDKICKFCTSTTNSLKVITENLGNYM